MPFLFRIQLLSASETEITFESFSKNKLVVDPMRKICNNIVYI